MGFVVDVFVQEAAKRAAQAHRKALEEQMAIEAEETSYLDDMQKEVCVCDSTRVYLLTLRLSFQPCLPMCVCITLEWRVVGWAAPPMCLAREVGRRGVCPALPATLTDWGVHMCLMSRWLHPDLSWLHPDLLDLS